MKPADANILIIDDNEDVLFTARMLLKDYYKNVRAISDPVSIPYHISHDSYDLVLLDMNYTGGDISGKEGLRWLREIKRMDPSVLVVMMTAYGTLDIAVQALKEGATDFVVKPWDNRKLLSTISTAYELRKTKKETEKLELTRKILNEDADKPFSEFIGESRQMKEIYHIIEKTAGTDASILILGENGTGKELVARCIHKQSLRSHKSMISVDLGSINENLFESELFGHTKGAFTDAKENRAGRFEAANGSTLFFDEIGNIPPTLQAKLLTVLQNREVTRMGSNKATSIDIRLICATNISIHEKVDSGEFREDLLYRINTIEIKVPPLREREGDIPLLAEHFMKLYGKKYRKLSLKISAEAMEKLENYSWPGNVRELQHVMERAVIMGNSRILKPSDFLLKEHHKKSSSKDVVNLEELKLITIKKVLEKNGGNISKTARELGISRAALYSSMEKYGLT
ncbi:MAG: response regulator with CheY-like receiver, AAA-type ATPase, and DNA-binding domain [Bacteroidetes bacterium]|jgi:DNA-binding NtrC family response regulator|nr:response regulator with CheY-like receiver, AAA-type ATPase, and DNA-binding domain [Bacteroidota bacterium]